MHLLLSRCPPAPLFLGDRLIIYHLARELAARFEETLEEVTAKRRE